MNKILLGDCLHKLKEIPDNSVDSIVTDPPYELGFMGKSWDNTGIANNVDMWKECLRVLKPGGYLLAFSGTRTYHRMASAIEDAGFEVRDMIEWVYSTGFPKSLNVWKQLKKNCTCGNMEAYEKRTKTLPQHDLRPMPETDLPQEVHFDTEQGKVLFTGLSEQSAHSSMQGEESKKGSKGRKKRVLEGRDNLQKTERELQGSDLPEMSERVFTNGEERRIYNATQVSDGSTPEKIIDENGSGASQRPQSEQQQDREPCAFCKQYGTQAIRTLGVGTALKPAHEPICMARKPLGEKTVAENCLKYGTGGINIDESRVATTEDLSINGNRDNVKSHWGNSEGESKVESSPLGRFPANLIHDNSEEVRECFPETNGGKARTGKKGGSGFGFFDDEKTRNTDGTWHGGSGNASRFFKSIPLEEQDEIQEECTSMEEKLEKLGISQIEEKTDISQPTYKSILYQAKASKRERGKGNNHPTVKPIALMEYLIKMVTKTGGTVLDPFAGSGSTLVAAKQNGFQYIGIEMTEEYIPIIEARLNAVDNKLF